MRGSTPSVKVTLLCYSAWLRDIHGHRYVLRPYIFTINHSNLDDTVLQSIVTQLLYSSSKYRYTAAHGGGQCGALGERWRVYIKGRGPATML